MTVINRPGSTDPEPEELHYLDLSHILPALLDERNHDIESTDMPDPSLCTLRTIQNPKVCSASITRTTRVP